MGDSITQSDLNIVNTANNITNNLIGTSNNLQENQMGLQQQILDLNKKGILLGTFYYRLFNPNTDFRNRISKRTKQTSKNTDIYNLSYESTRKAVEGYNTTDKEIENALVFFKGSSIINEVYSDLFDEDTTFPHRKTTVETIFYSNGPDTVIGTVLYLDGIVEGTSNITSLPHLTFTVLGATGRFTGANTLVVEFLNDKVFDSFKKDIRPRKVSVFT